ncbi:alkaline phosphatase D family protein [Gordonia sinesedis]
MMALVLGPILRHVGDTTASIWVQTDAPAVVEVLGAQARTFEVAGFHYAVVVVEGLAPDSTTEYTVRIDGEQAWPEAGSDFPPSVIQTRSSERERPLSLLFGSCRYPKTGDEKLDDQLGIDALDCHADRLARTRDELPDALILLGDQVYADELTPETRQKLAGKRRGKRRAKRPPDEVVTFSEYEELYRHTWSDPQIRWLMSTVPTAMIFDDHDIRDDWNTSAAWREMMAEVPWWRDRIRSGLACYWVYQHLGNLDADALRADPDWIAVQAAEGDVWPIVATLADEADAERDGDKGRRFSYRWDIGDTRLIMLDTRNGRILSNGQRKMLSDGEFDWLTTQLTENLAGVDHLVIGSSLPWLLPPALGDLQAVNEVAAGRSGWRGRFGEKIRQTVDFEHWPAFMESFDKLSELIRRVADDGGKGPATITVLSGDVHHSYAARADMSGTTAVHQLVCSPVHNHVPAYVRPAFTYTWSDRFSRIARRWARRVGAPVPSFSWSAIGGPLYGNTIAAFETDGRSASVVFEQPQEDGSEALVARYSLTSRTTS